MATLAGVVPKLAFVHAELSWAAWALRSAGMVCQGGLVAAAGGARVLSPPAGGATEGVCLRSLALCQDSMLAACERLVDVV